MGRHALKVSFQPSLPDLFPGDSGNPRVDLDPQQTTEGQDVPRDELFRGEVRFETSPGCDRTSSFPGIFEGRGDQHGDVTGGPVRQVRQDRHPPDHDMVHAFVVERSQEIGKVPGHRRILGQAIVHRRC